MSDETKGGWPKVLTFEEMERVYSEISERQLFEHYDGLCRLGDSHEALRARVEELEAELALGGGVVEAQTLAMQKRDERIAELEAERDKAKAEVCALWVENAKFAMSADLLALDKADLEAERDELRLTLAAERGDPENPPEGWAWDKDVLPEGGYTRNLHGFRLEVARPYSRPWSVHWCICPVGELCPDEDDYADSVAEAVEAAERAAYAAAGVCDVE